MVNFNKPLWIERIKRIIFLNRIEKGSVLVLSLLIVVVLLMIGGIFLGLTISNYNMIYTGALSESSFWIAKAGISQAVHDIKRYIFDKDTFLSLQRTWLNGVKLENGTYKVCIVPIKGLGTREIIIASRGSDIESRQNSALLVKMQISCPSDFLYFFNGNGMIAKYSRTSIYGPVHANGSIFLDTGQGGTYQGWFRIMKPDSENFRGPTLSATGIVFRGKPSDTWDGYDPATHWYPEPPLIIGMGNIEQAMLGENTASNYGRGFTNGTQSNNLDSGRFYITRFNQRGGNGPDPTQLIPSYPAGAEPDVTFSVKRSDGTMEKLLIDGKHGAYSIKIPSKEEIFPTFEPFIDKKWHITYSNLGGGKIVEFYNDVFLRKVPLKKVSDKTYSFENKGSELIGYVRYDNMWRVTTYPPLGNITHSESPIFSPILNYYHSNYFLYQDRGVSNVTVGGVAKNFGTDYLYFPVRYSIPNNIVFTSTSGIGAGSVGAEVKADKLKYIYASTDKTTYQYGPEISPLTYTISGNTITFKNSVGISDPVISYMNGQYFWERKNESISYKTASFISSPSITTIKQYDYTYNAAGGDYGSDGRIVKSDSGNFGTKYDEILTPEVKSSGYSYDGNNGQINYYDANNPVIVKGKPLLNYDTNNNRYWIELPLVWLPVATTYCSASTVAVNMTDRDTDPNPLISNAVTISGTGVIVAIVDTDGKFVLPTSHVAGAYGLVYETEYTISGDAYAYPGYVQLSSSIASQIPAGGTVLISYGSRYREITGVTGTIQSPETLGIYPCIDKYIKAVSIDLSQINENNYPKEGVIYSDVPLIVFGIPKKKITVVCNEEVYVNSINYSYRDNSGNWVSSSLVENDANAKPVAIISGKSIFAYYGANTGLPTFIKESKDGIITLNKVVLWSSSNDIFSFGTCSTMVNSNGSVSYANSINFFSGSQIFGNCLAVTEINDPYNKIYYIDTDLHMQYNYGGEISKLGYAESFREDLPPKIPLDIQVLNYRPIIVVEIVDGVINTLSSYLDKGEVPRGIYDQLANTLLQ